MASRDHAGRARVSANWLAPSVLFVTLTVSGCADSSDRRVPTWELTESLRIGSLEEGPASFGWVKSIEADSQGRIWVYDQQSQEVRIFGADGTHLRNVGRTGSGPGEFRNAEGVAFAADGRLWARDAANGRLSVFDAEGVFERAWPMTFCWSQGFWTPRMDRADRILDTDCMVKEGRARGYAVVAYRTDMSRVDTIAEVPECGTEALAESATWITRRPDGATYRQIPWAPRALSALGAAGETWCVPNSARYEILRLFAGAADTTRIVRSVPEVPVSALEKDSVIADVESNGPTGVDFSRIPVAKPAIERLTVDDVGRLWVRSTNAQGAIEFAIFSPEGSLIATARLGVYRTSTWQPFSVRGDHVYTVAMDAEGVPQVVRFSFTRPGR